MARVAKTLVLGHSCMALSCSAVGLCISNVQEIDITLGRSSVNIGTFDDRIAEIKSNSRYKKYKKLARLACLTNPIKPH
jgi:hypothetical protein